MGVKTLPEILTNSLLCCVFFLLARFFEYEMMMRISFFFSSSILCIFWPSCVCCFTRVGGLVACMILSLSLSLPCPSHSLTHTQAHDHKNGRRDACVVMNSNEVRVLNPLSHIPFCQYLFPLLHTFANICFRSNSPKICCITLKCEASVRASLSSSDQAFLS